MDWKMRSSRRSPGMARPVSRDTRGWGADIEPSNTRAKQLTATTSEAPLEYPAHARVGLAAGGVGFPVSGPRGRVDVSVGGDGERADPRRGQSEVRRGPRVASIFGHHNPTIGRSSD